MVKRKPRAEIRVADGAGRMMQIEDRRFEKGNWPIALEVPTEQEQADRWLRYFGAECDKRGWTVSGLGQLERAENSGTFIVTGLGKPLLDVVWERRRDGPLKVRARPALSSEFPLREAQQFFDQVSQACRSGATEPIYGRGTLQYEGRAWRGELWLDDKVRLAPPSLQDEAALFGPRVVHVDAILDCVGQPDFPSARDQLLQELSGFLSVVMGGAVRLPDQGRTWTWKFGVQGSEVRELGYMEVSNPLTMPSRGADKPVPSHPVDSYPTGDTNEISLRADIIDLWRQYRCLRPDQRRQFLQAAAKWHEAMIHWQERPSLSFALMVVACEALKPLDADDRFNGLDVVEALLGKSTADKLRQNVFPAQRVRSSHLHMGEFHGSELIRTAFLMSSYQDPSFRDAHRELARITPAAIIQWLKLRGTFAMPPSVVKKTVRRRHRASPRAARR